MLQRLDSNQRFRLLWELDSNQPHSRLTVERARLECYPRANEIIKFSLISIHLSMISMSLSVIMATRAPQLNNVDSLPEYMISLGPSMRTP